MTMNLPSRPVLLAVDPDQGALMRTVRELRRRLGGDYSVECSSSCPAAVERLRELHDSGAEVALVLSDQARIDSPDDDVLASARTLHPNAKRALLVEFGAWGDRSTADAILQAMATGAIDYYVLKPWRSPDEQFHRTIGEFLHEWSRDTGGIHELTLISDPWSRRGAELRDLLTRNGIPHSHLTTASPDGRRLLAEADAADARMPVVLLHGGGVLSDPSNDELARPTAWRRTWTTSGTSTWSSWAPGPPGSPRRSTARPRACARSSSSARPSAARPARARCCATTSGSPAGWAARSWPSAPTSRPGCSARASCSCARSASCGRGPSGTRSCSTTAPS